EARETVHRFKSTLSHPLRVHTGLRQLSDQSNSLTRIGLSKQPGPFEPTDNQKDLRTQPVACGSFAKRADVHLISNSSSGVPGWTIVRWSRPANVQYSSR